MHRSRAWSTHICQSHLKLIHREEFIVTKTMPSTILTSRRRFCCIVGTLVAGRPLISAFGQSQPPATATRPDVTAIDHDRILAAANHYLTLAPVTITSLPCPRSPGTLHDYYSEAAPEVSADSEDLTKQAPATPFTAHRDAVFDFGLAVPALTAAHLVTGDQRYADHAALYLRAWLVDPATRMNPSLDYGQVVPSAKPPTGQFQGILETLPLIEVAQSLAFLAATPALSGPDMGAIHAWFAAYLVWLTHPEDSGPRLPALARDSKSHHATSWLLQTSAYASLAVPPGDVARAEDSTLASLRHRFRTVTLRAQISAEGTFPHELQSATPYRDSLFNLDMLAAICQLLSTRFESVWDYQLEDGPGMRAAIAFHFPFIANRNLWPFRADNQHFGELPSRRSSLLLCARAYQRPEYAAAWKSLHPDPSDSEILRTIPIHMPVLWVRQPPHASSIEGAN
jgi:hypothetical protein